MVFDKNGLTGKVEQVRGEIGCDLRGGICHESAEFVATKPGNKTAALHTAGEPSGNLGQKQIADPVRKAVIDAFKAIQIDIKNGQTPLPLASVAQGSFERLIH